jgi:hypothetical protein
LRIENAKLKKKEAQRTILRRIVLAFCLFNSQFSILNFASALVEPFNPALFITDEEFNDAGAMNCEQVQAFLNERKGVLKTYASDGRPAAQIICENAARFSVNPRLLLTMMQKEMGLLTDTQPNEGALNWAMGCGPGWDSTRGFALNVECGARTLRRNFDRPGLGQEIIEGMTPANRGTLALFRYTEHIEGNKDFFDIWTRYFPNSAASGIPPEIYVDSRDVELTPVIKRDPACLNGWATGKKGRGNHMLLTPNVATQAESTNKATWRPNFPREGAYRVFVFISDREAAQWACGPVAARLDTANARYTIKHRDGVTEYAVNQTPIHDGWVELGSYYFTAGRDNYVQVDDVTGEPDNSRWVSIDDVKFVWLQP